MALKGGSMIFTGRNLLMERLASAGPGTINISSEKIYEVGNYQSLATIFDKPEITFTAESIDCTTSMEAMLLDVSPATEEGLDLAKARPINVLAQIKPGKKMANPFNVAQSVAVPYLTLESASYRFGLRDNATQTFSLRGDSIYYNQGAAMEDEFEGTGVAGQVVKTTAPSLPFVDGNGLRYVLAITAGTTLLAPGADYQMVPGVVSDETAADVTITLTNAVEVGSKIRVVYATPNTRVFPQEIHTPATVKPAAVRGKDIDVYVSGYDVEDPSRTAANKWTGVQSVTVDWRVTLEEEEEFGNYNAVSRDFDVPEVSGTIEILPRDGADLLRKIKQTANVSSGKESIGAATAVPLELDIILKDGQNGGATLKRLHIDTAKFKLPGFQPRPNQNTTMSIEWESDTGSLLLFRDLTVPRIVELKEPTAAAGAEVKILGINFVSVSKVAFGGVEAVDFEVESDHEITVTVPAGSGTVDVVITNSKGDSAVVPAGSFTYA